MAAILLKGQDAVTDRLSLEELMRGTEMSLIGRSDLLGINTINMFRRLSNQSFVEQLIATNRHQSADFAAQLKDDQTTIIVNKLPVSAETNGKWDTDKIMTGLIDLKITSANANGLSALAGPLFTVDRTEVEPFQWSESPIRNLPHYGQPDIWDYDLNGINWVWN